MDELSRLRVECTTTSQAKHRGSVERCQRVDCRINAKASTPVARRRRVVEDPGNGEVRLARPVAIADPASRVSSRSFA
jgi:hypothetical protein